MGSKNSKRGKGKGQGIVDITKPRVDKQTATKAKLLADLDKGKVDTGGKVDTQPVKAVDKLMAGAIKGKNAFTATLDKGKVDTQGSNDKPIKTHNLIAWVCQAYDVQVLDRQNGTVYHVLQGASHKKLIKQATFENKGGVFFGGMLNGSMADLATKGNDYLTVLHVKSNVYKVVKPTLTYGQLTQLQTAIVKVIGKGKLAIGALPDTAK